MAAARRLSADISPGRPLLTAQEVPPPSRTGLVPNFLLLLAAQVASKGTTLVALVLLSRYLGADFFGRFAIALAVPAAIEALADLGLGQALVREGAGRPLSIERDTAVVAPAKVALGAVLIAATFGIARALRLPDDVVDTATYLAVAKALDSLTILGRSVFEAHEHMEYEAASLVLDAGVRLGFVAYAMYSEFGIVGLAKAYVLSSTINMAATLFVAIHRFHLPVRPRISLARIRSLIVVGMPFALLWLLDGLSARANTVVLGLVSGDTAAGLFAAGYRLIEPLLIVPYTMATALLPLASRHLFEERATLPSLFKASMKLALTTATAASIILIAAARALIGIIFGDDFLGAVPVVGVLAFALVPLFARAALTNFLIVLDAQRILYGGQALGITTAVVVALVLAPRLGPVGTGFAILAGEVVVVGMTALVMRSVLPIASGRLGRCVATIAMSLVVAVALSGLRPVVSVPVALGFLIVAVRVLRVFAASEVRYLEGAVPMVARVSRLLLAPVGGR